MASSMRVNEMQLADTQNLVNAARALFADPREAEAIADSVSSRDLKWTYASGPWFSPLDPLGPELGGVPRGRLLSEADSDEATYHFALDSHGRVAIERAIVNHVSMRCTYFDHERCPAVAAQFSETRDGSFRKLERVHAFTAGDRGALVAAGYGASRVESVTSVEVINDLQMRCVSEYRYPKSSRREDRVVDSIAVIGENSAHPVMIRDVDGSLTYRLHKLGVSVTESEVAVLLEEAVLDAVHVGVRAEPVVAVALIRGNGQESFPPHVRLLYDDEFARLSEQYEREAWDPSLWSDRSGAWFDLDGYAELIEVSRHVRAESILADSVMHQACQLLCQDARWVVPTRFSKLICYPVNIEDGFVYDDWLSSLDVELRSELEMTNRPVK